LNERSPIEELAEQGGGIRKERKKRFIYAHKIIVKTKIKYQILSKRERTGSSLLGPTHMELRREIPTAKKKKKQGRSRGWGRQEQGQPRSPPCERRDQVEPPEKKNRNNDCRCCEVWKDSEKGW